MSVAIITGSAGLIGAEACRFFSTKGLDIVGIDNDMRAYFFGNEASTSWARQELETTLRSYIHYEVDIRNQEALKQVFAKYGDSISIIIHTAAQPSHDWAAKEPLTDFAVNANGTLNMLEFTRHFCPKATFIFISTNKVYGDTPNRLPLVEEDKRWEVDPDHSFAEHGIDESMSIDHSLHSIFGASKAAADIMCQEYGKYFGMNVGVFRGGCLTGPGHSGAMLHGFLAYLVKCAVTGNQYTVLGYKGKQVRDNIHSYDLVNCFWHFMQNPRHGEVYNIGGSRHSNCSMQEAIEMSEQLTGRQLNYGYTDNNRIGDHTWYISDVRKFQSHYPDWKYKYDMNDIMEQIYERTNERFG